MYVLENLEFGVTYMACMASPVPLSLPLHWPHLTSLAEQAGYKWRHINISVMHGKDKDNGGLNFCQEPWVVQLGFSDVIFLNALLNDTDFIRLSINIRYLMNI